MLQQVMLIMLGGALGAAGRFAVSNMVYHYTGRGFPYGTLTVNVVGSLLMGFLVVWFAEKWQVDPLIKSAVLVGFLGAFTTFSTFSLETWQLINYGQYMRAVINMVVSVVICLLAVLAGMQLAKYFAEL